MDENNNVGDRQWLKFGILAGILLIVVLVIALLRPLIFGRIVPAVMNGDGTTAVDDTTAVEEPVIVDAPVAPVDDATQDEGIVEETAVPPTNNTPTTDPLATPPAESEGSSGNEDTITTITYTVQAGDTIYSIARTYNVSPAAIVAANDTLTDPNNILIGSELLIPQP